MDDTNALIERRKAKLAALRAKGIDPFKNKVNPVGLTGCGEAHGKAKGELAGKVGEHTTAVKVAGRITAIRDMGKSWFLDIKDSTGRVQLFANKTHLEQHGQDFEVLKLLDIGDFISVEGGMFLTRTGEASVKVESLKVLGKSLRPPPDKWHGLEDTEIRYRQRYLDLMANPDVKAVMVKRSAILREIRNFLSERGYVEVETPMMQAIPGGAAAQPFITHHNALGCNFYLRIALELYLKRLLVGGFDKVFEIGRNFRNEGLSRRHNPEFTMLEAYQAFGDYGSMMELVQSMVCHVAQRVLGTLQIRHEARAETIAALNELRGAVDGCAVAINGAKGELDELTERVTNEVLRLYPGYDEEPSHVKAAKGLSLGSEAKADLARVATLCGEEFRMSAPVVDQTFQRLDSALAWLERLKIPKEINLTPPWPRRKYKDLVREKVREKTGDKVEDWFALSPAERRRVAIEDLKLAGDIADGYEDFEVTGAVFEKLVEPTLIQPTFVTHLPKELVPLAKLSPDDPTTVEVFELCINGQEIAPGYTEQNDPIEQRERLEHQAGGEQQKLDEDFLVALEHGMPPAGGIGIGIDRLCMMLLGQESIRDVILFPQLKPK